MAITKLVKAWLYADLLEKPEELALNREGGQGGLGLYDLQLRAQAFLLITFLQTSLNDNFRRNYFHEALLNYYVFDKNIDKPEIPPYFRGDFFPTLRRINRSPLGLKFVTLKQIYRFLIEEKTMGPDDDQIPRALIPLKCEAKSPANDWENSWRLAKLRGLGPVLTSFLLKLLWGILPTPERVARILPSTSAVCKLCDRGQGEQQHIGTLEHCMFSCPGNEGTGQILLSGLRSYIPGITPTQVLTLDIGQLSQSLEFPVTWTIAAFLNSLFTQRKKGKIVLAKIRSEIEADIAILREGKFVNEFVITSDLFRNIFG